MDNRSRTRHTKNFNTREKELAALLAERSPDGLLVKWREALAACGSIRAVYAAIESLTRSGWIIRKKEHGNGQTCFWAVRDGAGRKFPTGHFHDDPESFTRPLLAAQPAPREEWTR